jgi:hypothetical protein
MENLGSNDRDDKFVVEEMLLSVLGKVQMAGCCEGGKDFGIQDRVRWRALVYAIMNLRVQ